MAWLKHRNGPHKSPVFRQAKSSNWLVKSAVPNRRLSARDRAQRHANGEIATRAISMLAILTGNVGINGGNSGAREGSVQLTVCPYADLRKPIPDQHFDVYVDRCH